ncbi:MAG: universal stress protein [Burkholderiaceae bacterium]|nr:universal stress protein [Microbacteriaceae bacterium]
MEPGDVCIIVGVVPGQPDILLTSAGEFARRFRAELVCASVDQNRYSVHENPDGSVSTLPIDPDLPEMRDAEFDPRLRAHIAHVLDGRGIQWSTRALAGEPAHALGRLAHRLDAAMIIVGTREATVSGGIREFFSGSVAVHLAHRQHRPVVVIPLAPAATDRELPWSAS